MGNTSDLKKINMLGLIKAIYTSRSAIKPELARSLNLTMPTVHNFINELVSNNIVTETGFGISRGGRRAVVYSFNANLYHLLGVRITPYRIEIGLFDMFLNFIRQELRPIKFNDYTPEEGVRFIVSYIKDVIVRWQIDLSCLLSIGVTFPGPVDNSAGRILELPNIPHWNDIHAKAILEREIGHGIIVEKDSFSYALGLKWFGNIKPDNSLVYLAIEVGVGIGFLNDGKLFRGKHNMMGEIGHISVEPDGMLCSCGGRGCMDLYASDIGIIRRITERVLNGESPLLKRLYNKNNHFIDMPMILAAEQQGDRIAKEELEFCLKYIAECVIDIIKLYDPDKIIIGHRWLDKYPEMIAKLYEYIFMQATFINHESLAIEFNTITNLEVISAAAVVIEHEFSSVDNSTLLALL
jgi:predicted NBD/HSP70 family sugar kinase